MHQNPNWFWRKRIDLWPDDPEHNWHSLKQEGTAYYLDGLQHVNLANPALQELYATGVHLKVKVGIALAVAHSTDNDQELFTQLTTMGMHALESHLQPASGNLSWGNIMARITRYARNRMDAHRNSRSNIVFNRSSHIGLHVAPQGGTPYLRVESRTIPLPNEGCIYTELSKAFAAKQARISIQNRDNRCFHYCIMDWVMEWYNEQKSQRWPRRYCCYASDGAPIAKRHRHGGAMAPVNVGLECPMVGGHVPFPITDIYTFEAANAPKVGVFVHTRLICPSQMEKLTQWTRGSKSVPQTNAPLGKHK